MWGIVGHAWNYHVFLRVWASVKDQLRHIKKGVKWIGIFVDSKLVEGSGEQRESWDKLSDRKFGLLKIVELLVAVGIVRHAWQHVLESLNIGKKMRRFFWFFHFRSPRLYSCGSYLYCKNGWKAVLQVVLDMPELRFVFRITGRSSVCNVFFCKRHRHFRRKRKPSSFLVPIELVGTREVRSTWPADCWRIEFVRELENLPIISYNSTNFF